MLKYQPIPPNKRRHFFFKENLEDLKLTLKRQNLGCVGELAGWQPRPHPLKLPRRPPVPRAVSPRRETPVVLNALVSGPTCCLLGTLQTLPQFSCQCVRYSPQFQDREVGAQKSRGVCLLMWLLSVKAQIQILSFRPKGCIVVPHPLKWIS